MIDYFVFGLACIGVGFMLWLLFEMAKETIEDIRRK